MWGNRCYHALKTSTYMLYRHAYFLFFIWNSLIQKFVISNRFYVFNIFFWLISLFFFHQFILLAMTFLLKVNFFYDFTISKNSWIFDLIFIICIIVYLVDASDIIFILNILCYVRIYNIYSYHELEYTINYYSIVYELNVSNKCKIILSN